VKRLQETQPQQSQYRQQVAAPGVFDQERRFTGADPEDDFARKFELISQALNDDGIGASVEYPCCIVVPLPDDTELWFGNGNGPLGYSHVKDAEEIDGADDGPASTSTAKEMFAYVNQTIASKMADLAPAAASESKRSSRAALLVDRLLSEADGSRGIVDVSASTS
jgi:hypothetical protein